MLVFPGVASGAWGTVGETGGCRGKRGAISASAAHLLCAG